MSLWLEKKYLNMAAPRLERFVWKSEVLANLRCPFCGDSSKNKFKARGYFFVKKGSLIYHCHNCNVGMSVGNFLKQMNPQVYRQYVMEAFGKDKKKPAVKSNTASMAKESFPSFPEKPKPLDLPTIEQLGPKNPAKSYLLGRKIPDRFFRELYYAEDFKSFCDKLIPDHGKKLRENDPRIIIPFYDADNHLVYINARSIDPKNELRYIYMVVEHDRPKIFGLHRFDKTKKAYVTEGPFDSMFLPNAIASGGSNLLEVIPFIDRKNTVFVFDNEPRNSAIVAGMKKAIELGCPLFMWPDTLKQKDINELILANYTPSEVAALIDTHSVSGLQAKLQITQWSKT